MTFRDPVHSVFENELLREKILDYVIHDKNKVSYADIRSCRLVKKSWTVSTSKILHKCREPLFHLFLDEKNSLSKSAFVTENGKLLDKFSSTFTGTSRFEKQFPTIKIMLTSGFFHQENYESLKDCLNLWGNSLVDLDIDFPDNGGTLIFTFLPIAFPKLKNFTIQFTNDDLIKLEEGETSTVGGANCAYLMQLVLSGCKTLQKFVVRADEVMPYVFERLILPPKLISFELVNYYLENKDYMPLVRNELPRLKKLTLPIGGNVLAPGLIFKILENVKLTLKHLRIEGVYFYVDEDEAKQSTYFRLPFMEHLEHFQTDSIHLELEDGVSALQNCVPKLEQLLLHNQTASMFQKWTDGSTHASVKELTVRLVDENYTYWAEEYYIGFQEKMMRKVKLAFPNIRMLDIAVCGTDLCGLQYAFRKLKTLHVLKVTAKRIDSIVNSDYWDALLICTPVEFGTALRTTRHFWSDVKFGVNKDHPSIKNLTELQELHLTAPCHSNSDDPPTKLRNSLISDAVFHYAFLEMPKLKRVSLNGRFMVSLEMQEKWRKQSEGRVISYNNKYVVA